MFGLPGKKILYKNIILKAQKSLLISIHPIAITITKHICQTPFSRGFRQCQASYEFLGAF